VTRRVLVALTVLVAALGFATDALAAKVTATVAHGRSPSTT
jgi:hypothetical protein